MRANELGRLTHENCLVGLLLAQRLLSADQALADAQQAYGELSSADLDALVIYMQSLRPEGKQTAQTEPVAEPAVVPAANIDTQVKVLSGQLSTPSI